MIKESSNFTRGWLRGFVNLGADAKTDQITDEEICRQEDTVLQALRILEIEPGVVLADEVGMGKTYEALGVVAATLALRPRSNILIITPGRDLNDQWLTAINKFTEKGFYSFDRHRVATVEHITQLPERVSNYQILLAPIDIFLSVRGNDEREFILNAWFRYRSLWTDTRKAISKAYLDTVKGVTEVKDLGQYMNHWSWEELTPALEGAFSKGKTRGESEPESWEGLDDIFADGIDAFKNKDRVNRAIARARFKFLNRLLPNFSLLVIDEAHKLKNAGTIRSQAISNILFDKYDRTLFLTATPFQLSVEELAQMFQIFTYARINQSERQRLRDEVKLLFTAIRDYQQTYNDFERTWRHLDPEIAVEFRRWYEADAALSEAANPELGRLAVAVRGLRVHKKQVETWFRKWMIRSLKEDKRLYRKPEFHKVKPSERSFLPFLVYERLIYEIFRKGESTYKAAVEINMTSSYQSATQGSLLKEKGTDVDLKRYRNALRSLLGIEALRDDHPKIRHVVDEACEAMLAGQKTLIFCERVHSIAVIRDVCRERWNEHLEALWQKSVEAGEDIWKVHERLQKDFADPRRPHYLMLRENYVPTLLNNPGFVRENQAAIISDANTLLATVKLLSTSAERVDYKVAKRCLEAATFALAQTMLPGFQTGYPEHVLSAVKNIGHPDYLLAGLDLQHEGAEDETKGGNSAPTWRITKPIAEQVLFYPGIWFNCRNALGNLDPSDRVQFVEAVRSFLTRKEVEFLPILSQAVKESGETTPENFRDTLVAWWAAPNSVWRDRVNAFLRDCLQRGKSEREKMLEYALRSPSPVRDTLEQGSREALKVGFNSQFYPMILVANRPMQEGIDLHRECRRLVHHDLAWNPAQLEQRVGRLDRLGSKVRRDRKMVDQDAKLVIRYPVIDRTIDVRQYQVVREREKWLEFLLGAPPDPAKYDSTHLDEMPMTPLPVGLGEELRVRLEPNSGNQID